MNLYDFWKRVKQAINDLWYPRSVTVGKPVNTHSSSPQFLAIFRRSDAFLFLEHPAEVLGVLEAEAV